MCAMWYLLQPPRKIKYHIQYDKHNIEYITFINNMELRHRIKSILEYSDKNISEFQRFVGFKTPQAVSSLLNGKTKTLSKTAEMLLKYAFPEINENWLINGEGEMLKETTMDIDNVSGEGNTVGTIVNQTIKENSGQNAGRDIHNPPCPYGDKHFMAELEAQRKFAERQFDMYSSSLSKKDELLRAAQAQIATLIQQNQEQFSRMMALIETLKA